MSPFSRYIRDKDPLARVGDIRIAFVEDQVPERDADERVS